MPILSPEDRAVLWQKAITSDADARHSMLRVLAKEMLDVLGSRLDMYSGYEDLLVETLELLDASGYIGRDSIRRAFEEAEEDEHGPESLVVELAHQLREAADVEHLGVERRIRAVEAAARWRQELLERQSAEAEELTVAQVAAQFKVTPQAVYKWIEKERIEAARTPGGSWRIPAAQFSDDGGVDQHASVELQKSLVRLHGDRPMPTDEDLAEELSRRDDD